MTVVGEAMDLLHTLEARLDRKHSAVVVIDMQNDFCAEEGFIEKALGRDAATCRAVAGSTMELVRKAREEGVPVFWVRAIYDPELLPEAILVKRRQKTDLPCCAAGSWGAEFYGVTPLPFEAIIDKHSYSAFIGTDLDVRLRERGIRTLVFAGVQTNVCVECSLRDAVCMGYYAVLATDCIASYAQALHEATVRNVELLFGDVVPAETIASAWAGRGPAGDHNREGERG